MKTQITVTLTRPIIEDLREPHPVGQGTGTRWVKVGELQALKFLVTIDADKLVGMIGHKALRSKGRVSRLQRGSVEVKPLDVVRVDTRELKATP